MVAKPEAPPTEVAALALVPKPPEKRADAARRRVTIPATILCPDGSAYACVIREMSPSGARLAVSRRHRLPAEFAIAVAGDAPSFPVRRAWQRGDFAGVALVAA